MDLILIIIIGFIALTFILGQLIRLYRVYIVQSQRKSLKTKTNSNKRKL